MPRLWVRSPAFDSVFLVGPPIFAALAVLAIPSLRSGDTPHWGWVVLVIGVDVAHVWSTLYRTYLDSEELERRPELYSVVPVLCWATGALLYKAGGALWFWRVLAYLAVFHFVRQQYGFLRLYQRLEGLPSRLDDALDRAALYGGMLYPLVYWHSTARPFAWFMAGDFVKLPPVLAAPAGLIYALVLIAWVLRQAWRSRSSKLSLGRLGVVSGTATAWWVGIVGCSSDLAFTLTNVVAHGVPYFGLVWLTSKKRPQWLLGFLALPLLLAWLEEGAWDLFIWREHAAAFFGLTAFPVPALGPALTALLVPLLALPQATHYVLDAWIWRMDGSNPGLKEALLSD